ncbi:hypothetical protein Syun_022872 [Stephania yunnanensis]|uniref:Pentatricopeptide repeat-containing protein n=1 Tax=Stephania yunnanensis TaxID=152371 RepID=A0AAP0I320_9MAGN
MIRCLQLLEKCKNMRQMKQAHAQIITFGLGNNSYAVSRIMAFCSHPQMGGSLNHACKLFEQIPHPTICIFNTMIKAFLLKLELVTTIEIYKMVLKIGMCPDNYTLPYVLKACTYMRNFRLGEQFHGHILKFGLLCDIYVGNSLISLYSGCGAMEEAREVFHGMAFRTVVSWTIMISGYAKQCDIDNAYLLFDAAPVKDKVVWGAIISGYVQNNCFKEGLHMFRLMQMENLELDEAVFVSALCACAHLGAMDIGIWIHRYLGRIKMPLGVKLATALIDMYTKCGNMELAWKLFHGMRERDIICWNVMLYGLAIHGDGENAFKLFTEMVTDGFIPDDITFIAMFTACSYSGMASEGLDMLNNMNTLYGVEPKSEHYGCVVDFLGRVGMFDEAKEIIRKMPNLSNPSEEAIAWRALLSACCNHGETQLAKVAAERLMKLEGHSGAYVLLSNLYSSYEKFDDARRIRKMMKDRGVDKEPGCSFIEVDGNVHEFLASEKTHPRMEEICELLEKMSEQLESSACKPYILA